MKSLVALIRFGGLLRESGTGAKMAPLAGRGSRRLAIQVGRRPFVPANDRAQAVRIEQQSDFLIACPPFASGRQNPPGPWPANGGGRPASTSFVIHPPAGAFFQGIQRVGRRAPHRQEHLFQLGRQGRTHGQVSLGQGPWASGCAAGAGAELPIGISGVSARAGADSCPAQA